MWGTFSAIAHFERRLISERMMDGIDAARVKVSPTEAARQRTSAFRNCSSLGLFSVLSAHCPQVARATPRLPMPFEPEIWLADRKVRLADGLQQLARAARAGAIPGGSIEDGVLKIDRLSATVP